MSNEDTQSKTGNSVNGFEKLIQAIPRGSVVLDVGAGGLEGFNTTDFLIARFGVKNVKGICIRPEKVEAYKGRFPEMDLIVGDFYKESHYKEKSFDLVVLDLNIDNNIIKDWSLEGLAQTRDLIKEGGMLINYVMTTDQYGDENETPALIRKRWKEFWHTDILTYEDIGKRLTNLPGYELFAHEVEEIRSYIMWVALRKV